MLLSWRCVQKLIQFFYKMHLFHNVCSCLIAPIILALSVPFHFVIYKICFLTFLYSLLSLPTTSLLKHLLPLAKATSITSYLLIGSIEKKENSQAYQSLKLGCSLFLSLINSSKEVSL